MTEQFNGTKRWFSRSIPKLKKSRLFTIQEKEQLDLTSMIAVTLDWQNIEKINAETRFDYSTWIYLYLRDGTSVCKQVFRTIDELWLVLQNISFHEKKEDVVKD